MWRITDKVLDNDKGAVIPLRIVCWNLKVETWRLSSKNFPWYILEYFVPCVNIISHELVRRFIISILILYAIFWAVAWKLGFAAWNLNKNNIHLSFATWAIKMQIAYESNFFPWYNLFKVTLNKSKYNTVEFSHLIKLEMKRVW